MIRFQGHVSQRAQRVAVSQIRGTKGASSLRIDKRYGKRVVRISRIKFGQLSAVFCGIMTYRHGRLSEQREENLHQAM